MNEKAQTCKSDRHYYCIARKKIIARSYLIRDIDANALDSLHARDHMKSSVQGVFQFPCPGSPHLLALVVR